MNSAMTIDLLAILARRRGGWGRHVVDFFDGLFSDIAYLTARHAPWLPGEWWYYAVGAIAAPIGLRMVIGWVVRPFRDG